MGISKKIEVAVDGEMALKLLAKYSEANEGYSPDLILLDLDMPVMDGFSFIDKFEKLSFKNKTHVKVIVLSSSYEISNLWKT